MQRFIPGLVAATAISILLFAMAEYLVRPTQAAPCADCGHHIQLDPVFRGEPPEEKIRRPHQPPEPPAEPPKPSSKLIVEPPPPSVVTPTVDRSLLSNHGPAGIAINWQEQGSGQGDGGLVITRKIAPQYPSAALRDGVEGEVEVEFTVQPDGSVSDIRIIAASPRGVFEHAVRRAVAGWGFRPRMVDGKPIATRARQVLTFTLPDGD